MRVCSRCWGTRLSGYSFQMELGLCRRCGKQDGFTTVIEIDDLLAPSIIALNKKGYVTNFCCSGHLNKHSSYIWFNHIVPRAAFPNFPEGYKADPKNQYTRGVCIRRFFIAQNQNDRYRLQVQSSLDVLRWAESLPTIKGK